MLVTSDVGRSSIYVFALQSKSDRVARNTDEKARVKLHVK